MKVFIYQEDELKQYIYNCSKSCPVEVDLPELVQLIIDDSEKESEIPNRYHGIWGTKFISISDVGIDFLAFIMCNGLADYVAYCVSNQNLVLPSAGLAVQIAYFIYSELKKVVQLRGDEYCIYKQAVTHFKRHEDFSLEEMIEWLSQLDTVCNMHNDKLYCRYRDNDLCTVKGQKERVLDIMQAMVDKEILKPGQKENTFKLNY